MNNTDDARQKVIGREIKNPGLRGRINAMCAYCIYDPCGGGGNWRQQVEACTTSFCPLFPVRPISGRVKGEKAVQAEKKAFPALLSSTSRDSVSE